MRCAPWVAEGPLLTCIPLRDLEDDVAFISPIECPDGPVTATRNECDAPVAMTSDYYEATSQESAYSRLLGRVSRAEAELAAGDYEDGASFIARMRDRS